ncbi:MAG: toxin-antitoxin system HicB family antitoxin [Dehalococcoidia bacterium]
MRNIKIDRDLDFYLRLKYPVKVHQEAEGGFVAEIEELPGCMTQAETPENLFHLMEDARRGWIEAAYESGQEIPLPRGAEEYSGKFLVRVPRSLHRDLARAAAHEGISLNQYVTALLANGNTVGNGAMAKRSLLSQYVERTNSRGDIKPQTKRQYITDAIRILESDEELPGPGYRTVWKELTELVKSRFERRLSR